MSKDDGREKLSLHSKMKMVVALALFLFLVALYQNELPEIHALEAAGILVAIHPKPISTGPSIPLNQSNSTVAVNLTQELNNSANYGFRVNASMFYATSSTQCTKQLVAPCDNNIPDQQICINTAYESLVASQYGKVHSGQYACPLFILEGDVNCGLVNDYCVVLRSHQPMQP